MGDGANLAHEVGSEFPNDEFVTYDICLFCVALVVKLLRTGDTVLLGSSRGKLCVRGELIAESSLKVGVGFLAGTGGLVSKSSGLKSGSAYGPKAEYDRLQPLSGDGGFGAERAPAG